MTGADQSVIAECADIRVIGRIARMRGGLRILTAENARAETGTQNHTIRDMKSSRRGGWVGRGGFMGAVSGFLSSLSGRGVGTDMWGDIR